MDPVFTMEEIIFFNNLLLYMKRNNPAALSLMIESGITEVADTLEQIANGDR
jgi:hypothetical protein